MMTMPKEKEPEGLEVLHCKRCGNDKDSSQFFRLARSEERCDICKDCLKQQLDINDPRTFLWILKKLDYPFIEHDWKHYVEKFNDKSVLGRYISRMRLKGYKAYTYADSEELNLIRNRKSYDIESLTSTNKDVIVVRYTQDQDVDTVFKMFKNVSDSFPDNTVIAIPSDVTIEAFTKDECERFLDEIENNLKKFIADGQT